jgi:diaminohydroxyphosphoribosylaminopyrimidine deaminase/5-amino-6-(5-phosphoribosylamino)uracil reductase
VLTSAATVLADDPRLDVRIETPRQPLRVVLDRRRTLRKTARILAPPGEVLVFAAPTATRKPGSGDEQLGSARVERVRVTRSHLDLGAIFARLAELEVNDVLVEAGSRFAGALFAAGLVDEWLLYIAPKLLGKDAKPLTTLGRLTSVDAAPGFVVLDSKAIGPDMRLRLRPRANEK